MWKVQRIIKDTADVEKLEQIVLKYYGQLKHIYTVLISTVDYPNIGWLKFTDFIQGCKVVDANCPLNVVDRCFIAANYEVEDLEENPDRALQRYEFIEILVRIAEVKFKLTKQVTTFSAAFERLLHEHIFKYYTPEPWQEFRDE